jgi:hypothetical protein
MVVQDMAGINIGGREPEGQVRKLLRLLLYDQ